MTNEYLLERGYKKYPPSPLDNEHVVARFQKRFDDNFGKKYFINVIKWSNDFIPVSYRDEFWNPFVFEYEVYTTMSKEQNALNLKFYTNWTLEDVEKFMEDFFEKMKPNYYEAWDEERGVRPGEEN